MLMPELFDDTMDTMLDNFFYLPAFNGTRRTEKNAGDKLYGHNAGRIMKADIREKENSYEILVDLPGFKKDEITIQLEKGILTITAAKGLDKEEDEKETGRYLRRERYAGISRRSFNVGTLIRQEDIHAGLENGILTVTVPKKKPEPEKKENLFIRID